MTLSIRYYQSSFRRKGNQGVEGLGNLLKSTQLVSVELEMKSRQLSLKSPPSATMPGWHTVGTGKFELNK